MPQSLAQVYLHVVFSTKLREPFFVDRAMRGEVHDYLFIVSKKHGCQAKVVGGFTEHVHLLVNLSRTITMADFVRELKRDSSKWIKTLRPELEHFQWQVGYGAFSIGPGHVETVKQYILNQEEHHQTVTFQDEFRRICSRYDLEIDERYVWD